VSSPGFGDGKTTTAINLAGALAQGPDARVLLIDADLRRPAIRDLIGTDETSGPDIVRAATDPELALDDLVRLRRPFNLSVICAGRIALASPYEVLKSPRVVELMVEARRRYDYVVIDTPPLVPTQDCRVIGRWVDGFLVVVAAGRTPRRLLGDALAAVEPSKLVGVVFNLADRPPVGRYSSYGGRPWSNTPSGRARGTLARRIENLGRSLWRPAVTLRRSRLFAGNGRR
jgi:capsular exopolysaccharide synthesis family protein